MDIKQPSHSSYSFYHYSFADHEAIDLTRTYTQTADNLVFHTPKGLWLSVAGENDWEHYCRKTQYSLEKLQSKFQIVLKPEARLLVLSDTAAFEAFEKEYGHYAEGIDKHGGNYTLQMSIHWEKIISDYQGLAVTAVLPKLYNMGLWYDTWCCTCACIWDLQAVERIKKLS